jgi:hypothetical protein
MAFLWASYINFPVSHITLHHSVVLYEDIVPDNSSSPLSICKGGSTTSHGARTCFHDHFSVVGRNLELRSMSTDDEAITDRISNALLVVAPGVPVYRSHNKMEDDAWVAFMSSGRKFPSLAVFRPYPLSKVHISSLSQLFSASFQLVAACRLPSTLCNDATAPFLRLIHHNDGPPS